MDGCGDCCVSPAEKYVGSAPQHQLISLPRLMGSVASPVAGKNTAVNPYEILQIRRDATPIEIRQSYKRLALFNHPGREATAQEGRLQRWQSFNLLAACYETLMDPDIRRRYDNICREIERSKLQAGVRGALFVGGKPLRSRSFDEDSMVSGRKKGRRDNVVPGLSRASSQSTATEEECEAPGLDHEESCCAFSQEPSSFTSPSRKHSRSVTAATLTTKGSAAAPSLVDATTSEDEEDAEAHFTESTTRRLFGGPLSNLFKARNFEAFSDPYDIFEGVFGSQPFPRVSRKDIRCADDAIGVRTTDPVLLTSPRSPAAWRGEKHISSDGKSTIYTTSRIVHDRRLTRTETVTRTPNGMTKTYVSVTAEQLTPTNVSVANDANGAPSNTCLICFRPTVVDDNPEHKGICDDACLFYESVVQQLDFTREEFIEEWRRMISYNMPFNVGTSSSV
jgi:curved DNA-binding protein CbpA